MEVDRRHSVLWRSGALRSSSRRGAASRMPSERRTGAPAWAERLVPALLGLTALAGLGFVALFVLDPNTQLLGLCLGGALALLAARSDPRRPPTGAAGDEGRGSPDARATPRRWPRSRQQAREGLDGITRRKLIGGAAGRRGRRPNGGGGDTRGRPRPRGGGAVERHPVARGTRAGRRRRQPDPGRERHRRRLRDGLSARRGQGRSRRARGRGARRPRQPGAARRAGELGAGGDPRLLEDLHARRLRDLPVPLAAEPHHPVARSGADLSLPLLDLRRARRRQRRVRPRRPGATAAAAADRRHGRAHGRRADVRARGAVLVGGQQ